MNTREIAKKLAIENRLIRAEKYDLVLREYDKQVELIGWVQDPTVDMKEFEGREMLFPKRWVTLAVFDENKKVKV
jgi:hypothetical protein